MLPMNSMPSNHTSSLIDASEEDAEILQHFFCWKITNTWSPERQMKWEHTCDIVLANDWYIKDLQVMEDGCSAMYNHAIKAGISDGITRGFKDEL